METWEQKIAFLGGGGEMAELSSRRIRHISKEIYIGSAIPIVGRFVTVEKAHTEF